MKKVSFFLLMLIFPVIVFASESLGEMPMYVILGIEAFCSIHMSIFFLFPLAKTLNEENYKKTFTILFIIRAIILIVFNFVFRAGMATFDMVFIFIGVVIILPIVARIKKKDLKAVFNYKSNKLKCPNCGASVTEGSVTCSYCQAEVNPTFVSQVSNVKYVKYEEFDEIYKLNEKKMVNTFIKKEIEKLGLELKSNYVPSEIAKRKKILNIIFSVLLFIYISMIFFHYPIFTYILGFIILTILFIFTKKYNLVKYITKQVESRPNEKISNIILNIKNDFVPYNKFAFLYEVIAALIIPIAIFVNPIIIYEHVDGGYAVRYYLFGWNNYKTVEIPETHKGEKVISIRGNGFSNMPFLESVKLPDTITEIRGQAFANDINLTEVKIPSKLEYLGGGSFYNCQSIKSVILPDTLTYLGGESFVNASSLTEVKLSNNLTEIRGNTFEYCTSLTSIDIPDSVTRIGAHAFYGNTRLSKVNISENSKLQEIGSSAFRNCSSLREIKIPLRTIVNDRAFKNSPTTVTRYGDEVNYNEDDTYETPQNSETHCLNVGEDFEIITEDGNISIKLEDYRDNYNCSSGIISITQLENESIVKRDFTMCGITEVIKEDNITISIYSATEDGICFSVYYN